MISSILALSLSLSLVAQSVDSKSGNSVLELLKTREACAILSDLFEGNPSKERIQRSLDKVLRTYNTPVTEENRLRAGSVLIKFRKDEGAREIHFLEYLVRHATPDTSLKFPEAVAAFLAAYKIDYPNGSPPDLPATSAPTRREGATRKPGGEPKSRDDRKPTEELDKRAASKLGIARALEKQGNSKGALSFYREVVEKYPGTPAAKTARAYQSPGGEIRARDEGIACVARRVPRAGGRGKAQHARL